MYMTVIIFPQHSMLFFFHHYELPVILSHQADPEEDLLADPIAALTDEVNVPAADELPNHPPPGNFPVPNVPFNDGTSSVSKYIESCKSVLLSLKPCIYLT